MTAKTPILAADLDTGLRRLRLGAMRRLAPELLVTAKTQRWAPEEFLRTLVETEIASRDASNARARLKQAGFPVMKTLDEFNVAARYGLIVFRSFDDASGHILGHDFEQLPRRHMCQLKRDPRNALE